MTDNEQIVRKAYKIAEDMDMAAWSAAFTPGRHVYRRVHRRHLAGAA
jgi:hypothetical protein